MREQDLFTAIGGTEDAFLMELDEPPSLKRFPKQFGLIAAIFVLLLTACAAPVVIRSFDKLRQGSIVESEQDIRIPRVISSDGTVVEADTLYVSRTVSLEVDVDEDAPETIQSRYIPAALLERCTVEACTDSESLFSLELSMDGPKNSRITDIRYQQLPLPKDGKMEVQGILSSGIWRQKLRTYGRASVLEITGLSKYETALGEVHIGHMLAGGEHIRSIQTRQIFWSDGLYLYALKLPFYPPYIRDSKFEEIITSLTPVEDITEYLAFEK